MALASSKYAECSYQTYAIQKGQSLLSGQLLTIVPVHVALPAVAVTLLMPASAEGFCSTAAEEKLMLHLCLAALSPKTCVFPNRGSLQMQNDTCAASGKAIEIMYSQVM